MIWSKKRDISIITKEFLNNIISLNITACKLFMMSKTRILLKSCNYLMKMLEKMDLDLVQPFINKIWLELKFFNIKTLRIIELTLKTT